MGKNKEIRSKTSPNNIEYINPNHHDKIYFEYMYPDLNLDDSDIIQEFSEEVDHNFFEEPRRIYVLKPSGDAQFHVSEPLDGDMSQTWKAITQSIFG